MKRYVKKLKTGVALLVLISSLAATGAVAFADQGGFVPATPFDGDPLVLGGSQSLDTPSLSMMSAAEVGAVGDVVDVDAALAAGADYLKHAQADVTEDNAGNGDPDSPDDPDDGGWNWMLTDPDFTHSTSGSSTNLYGATALGLYYAYLVTGDTTYMTAMQDAADAMTANADIDSASDLIFLMRFQDLTGVTPDVYEDAAKTKYDARIADKGSATAFAEYVRDHRASQGYENGIIPWDIGLWAVAAQMLDERYPSPGYDGDADDFAEVIYQDSFNNNPGYFDLTTDKNKGWDPTYANTDYYWFTLGISGLLDAFVTADVHASEISGLIDLLFDSQYPTGAFSYCYGANADDEDWQSAAYAVTSLARLDQATYQTEINYGCYWIGATQDSASGGWVYSSGNHYPEVGGECTAALYFGENADAVWVDDDYCDGCTNDGRVWGYDAFATIEDGIDGVADSGTVNVAPGTYSEGLITIDKSVSIQGDASTKPLINPIEDTVTGHTGWFEVTGSSTVADFHNLQFDGSGQSISQCIRYEEGPSGTVENCDFSNISDGQYSGIGVVYVDYSVYGGSADPLDLSPDGHVKDCAFNNIQRIGVSVFGVDMVYVQGNTYVGKGDGDWLDYGIEVGGGGVGSIEDNDIQSCTGVASIDDSTSAAILVTTYYGDGTEATVTGNTLTANSGGVAVGYDASDSSTVVVHQNKISGNADFGVDSTGPTVDATLNWWGATDGPGPVGPGSGDSISDYVDFSPWCSNQACTASSYYVASGGTIQDAINAASSGDTIYVQAGTYNESLIIDTPNLTFILEDGVIIEPSSPCWIVNASTKLQGGVCTPSDGSNGIETGAALDSLVIRGMEIHADGTGSGDGIHVGHNVDNLQIFDNYVHDMGGDGVEYASTVTIGGVHEVQGNLFQDNGGDGINDVAAGSFNVEYNSWGDIAGPNAGEGDGASTSLDFDPWTHVALSMVSSGSPQSDEVAEGYQIAYTVQMDASEVWGADFDLNFPTGSLEAVSITDAGLFDHQGTCDVSTVAEANAAGAISFCGQRSSALNGSAQDVYTVVFQAKAGAGGSTADLNLDEADDAFAMVTPSGGSNNVYASALDDGEVTIYDATTVSGRIDLQGRPDDTGAVMTFGTGSDRAYGPYTFSDSGYWGQISASAVVYEDTYAISVEMDLYLDVTASSSKDVTITGDDQVLATLVLLGGDANDDDTIDVSDATIIGSDYGNSGTGMDYRADINADDIVDILDLVLMGGNYGLASDTAYGGWTP